MNKLRRFLAIGGISLAGVAGNLMASSITQTFNVPLLTSDVTALQTAGNFQYWQDAKVSLGAPGTAVLSSVTLAVTLHDQVTALDITNSTGSAQNYSEELFVKYTLGGTAPDAALVAAGHGVGGSGYSAGLATDIYTIGDPTATPPVLETIANGAEQCWVGPCGALPQGSGLSLSDYVTFANLGGATGDGLWTSGAVTAANASLYDTTGNFSFNYKSTTLQTNSSGAAFTPTDQSFATYQVIYNYTIPSGTPEPATLVLTGSALLGLGFLRRRRKA
jgi:hypothetical protein